VFLNPFPNNNVWNKLREVLDILDKIMISIHEGNDARLNGMIGIFDSSFIDTIANVCSL
jgi:hypothetical protein